jgi:hypothetical protein
VPCDFRDVVIAMVLVIRKVLQARGNADISEDDAVWELSGVPTAFNLMVLLLLPNTLVALRHSGVLVEYALSAYYGTPVSSSYATGCKPHISNLDGLRPTAKSFSGHC